MTETQTSPDAPAGNGRFWYLSPVEFDATVEKVEKLNARAQRRGFTGRVELTGEREVRVREVNGFKVEEIIVKARIAGEAPSYNGWQLLASLDWDPAAGLIVRTAPGVESVDRAGLVEGWCGHCNSKRHRKATYLVAHEDGRRIQVGSTCIKDFLGWNVTPSFISASDLEDEVSSGFSDLRFPRTFSAETVLAVAWAAIKTWGYVKANEWQRTPTKVIVGSILDPFTESDRKLAREMRPVVDQAADMARAIRAFLLSDEFAGVSEYVTNLKAIAAADEVSPRNLGFLVSAPQAWARAQEQTLIRQRERAEVLSEWVGEIGQRIDIQVRVKLVNWGQDNGFGAPAIYTLVDQAGHVFKWWSTKAALGEKESDEFVSLRGTIKNHSDWRGTKETNLTRCKMI
jgi:hypothetical protein